MSFLPDAAATYFTAVNRGDLLSALSSFHPQARILDVDRMIAGIPDIREWLIAEVLGGRYRVIDITPLSDGTRVLLEFTPPDASDTFQAHYTLTFRDGAIETANLQYA